MEGRIVPIMGCAGAMGRAIAALAHDRGARVALLDRDESVAHAAGECEAVLLLASPASDFITGQSPPTPRRTPSKSVRGLRRACGPPGGIQLAA